MTEALESSFNLWHTGIKWPEKFTWRLSVIFQINLDSLKINFTSYIFQSGEEISRLLIRVKSKQQATDCAIFLASNFAGFCGVLIEKLFTLL
jgi:hypothetical protein